MPYFSILIPVYNQEGKMDCCFDCLKNQTFKDYEIIFVDDGSTDKSLDLLHEYCKNDNKARIIEHKENKSLLYARWTAMGEAKGKYVVFLDSDDAFTYDALEKLHNYFEKTHDDAVRFGFKFKYKNIDVHPLQDDIDSLMLYFTGKVPPAIWKNAYSIDVIKKSYETIEPFYCNMAEDSFYVSVLFTNAKKVGVMNDIIYIYTDDSGMSTSKTSLSSEKFKKALNDLDNSSEHFLKYIEKYNPKYLDFAKKQSLRIKRFLGVQYIIGEEDWHKVFDILSVLNNEKYEDSFNYCFDKVLDMRKRKISGEKFQIPFDLDLK